MVQITCTLKFFTMNGKDKVKTVQEKEHIKHLKSSLGKFQRKARSNFKGILMSSFSEFIFATRPTHQTNRPLLHKSTQMNKNATESEIMMRIKTFQFFIEQHGTNLLGNILP
jgi:hypothetical protein